MLQCRLPQKARSAGTQTTKTDRTDGTRQGGRDGEARRCDGDAGAQPLAARRGDASDFSGVDCSFTPKLTSFVIHPTTVQRGFSVTKYVQFTPGKFVSEVLVSSF